MTKGVSLLTIGALFLSGVAIGALGMHLYYAERLTRPGAPPAMAGRLFADHLERRLELTADQRVAIRRILADSRREGAQFRERMRPEVEALMERTRREIEVVLTPDQRRKLDEIRRLEHPGLEQLLIGPAPHPRPPRDRGGRWRGRRPPRSPAEAPPPPGRAPDRGEPPA